MSLPHPNSLIYYSIIYLLKFILFSTLIFFCLENDSISYLFFYSSDYNNYRLSGAIYWLFTLMVVREGTVRYVDQQVWCLMKKWVMLLIFVVKYVKISVFISWLCYRCLVCLCYNFIIIFINTMDLSMLDLSEATAQADDLRQCAIINDLSQGESGLI